MSLTKQYFKYVSQNIFGLLGTSCYILADTYFISQAAGTSGVALLNLCLPIYNFIFAIGSMLGLGAATRYAILRAQGDERSERYFSNALLWALVFALPFLFDSSAQGQALCDSDVGQQILGTLEDIGIKGLGWMEYGMRNITNSVRPIETPEDLQGIKIRTMENPIHMAAFQVMGADPTPMAFGELFTALQQGTIDAQENPLSVITSSRFNEVQDYLSMTEHVYSAAPLMVSKAAYDALPDDLKAIVDEAGTEACQWEREYLAEVEVQWLDELETAGTQINYPDKAPFVEAMSSVYDEFVGDGDDMVSPELLEQVREIISQVE